MVEKFMIDNFMVDNFMVDNITIEEIMVEKFGVKNFRVELSCNPFKECQSRGTTRGLSTRGPHEVALLPSKSLRG